MTTKTKPCTQLTSVTGTCAALAPGTSTWSQNLCRTSTCSQYLYTSIFKLASAQCTIGTEVSNSTSDPLAPVHQHWCMYSCITVTCRLNVMVTSLLYLDKKQYTATQVPTYLYMFSCFTNHNYHFTFIVQTLQQFKYKSIHSKTF